jgi:AcrR family transcriptional regulator
MTRKSQQRSEQKRSLILKEAKTVLKRHGKATTMSDIARALGMDTSSLYYYFKNIPEIIDTILNEQYHDFSLNSVKWRTFKGGSIAALKEMLRMLLEFYYDNQEILGIILTQVFPLCVHEDHEDESIAINHFMKTYWEANASILHEIEKACKEKKLGTAFPPQTILLIIRGTIFGLWASWNTDKPEKDRLPEIVDRMLEMFK